VPNEQAFSDGEVLSASQGAPPEVILTQDYEPIFEGIAGWPIRWGMPLILTALLVVLGVTWFLRYPVIVIGRVVITSNSPSIPVVAKSSGNLTQLIRKRSGATVEKGEVLAIVTNKADCNSVFSVRDAVLELGNRIGQGAPLQLPETDSTLGDLQNEFVALLQTVRDYNDTNIRYSEYIDQRIENANRKVACLKEMRTQLQSKVALATAQVSLSEQDTERMELLEKSRAASVQALDARRIQATSFRLAQADARALVVQNEIATVVENQNIAELEDSFHSRSALALKSLQSAVTEFLVAFESWEERYVLRACADGVLSTHEFWNEGQYIREGEELFLIVPPASTIWGAIDLEEGVGSIVPGQHVRIKLADYPYEKHGMVFGEVTGLSEVAHNGRFRISVGLPDGLRTQDGTAFAFREGMQGRGEVVTERPRLLAHLFSRTFGAVLQELRESR